VGGGDGHGGDDHDGELPHLPPPSIRPFIMTIGLLLIGYGLIYVSPSRVIGLILLLGGLLVFAIGFGGWIYDDVRASRAGNHGHDGH
jgi:hypothetical protein